jgi:hypothetical protein
MKTAPAADQQQLGAAPLRQLHQQKLELSTLLYLYFITKLIAQAEESDNF